MRETTLLKLYCMGALAGVEPIGCIGWLEPLCGEDVAKKVSKYWEGKGMQEIKAKIEPVLVGSQWLKKGKLNRQQAAGATVAFLEKDYGFLMRALNTYR